MDHRPGWLFGHISYDVKNQVEELSSENPDSINFPDIAFFEPQFLLHFKNETVEFIIGDNHKELIDNINNIELASELKIEGDEVFGIVSKEEYIRTVNFLKQHIVDGDIYEINYCIEFLAKNIQFSPANFHIELSNSSPAPFSSFYKLGKKHLLGASPERYLNKRGNKVISQPIKGTARRGLNSNEDDLIKKNLRASEKELAENMMIVDLVRNDLARSCAFGSVKVEEMFGVYTFRHLHQMISTVSGELRPEIDAVDVIKNSFPMGSMTGAPKIKVMELIERYENFKRGVYSGTVGYFTPEGDFDFNVVIRSLLYDQLNQVAAFHVGSAITYDADPEQEYNECLLKASAIKTLLKNG
ncbi:MAG: anthranilate synthase component I family protein [Bacteroidota bacterium]